MKVYVDELPKSCERCPFHDTKYGICDISGSRVEYFGCHSLTPLSDHDKQIRKEVVQEIKKQSHSCLGEQYIDHAKNNVVFSHHIIIDTTILNQIENGGINEKID